MAAHGMTPRLTAAVAREIHARCEARVRSVHQDGPLAFRIDVRGEARDDLVIDLGAPFPRVHFADPRPAPAQPTALANALRQLLKGARLVGADAIRGERALRVTLRRGGEDVVLWVELFGGQSNLYVVSAAGKVLLTPRGDVAKRRAASKGMAFEPVPSREPTDAGSDADVDQAGSAAVQALVEAAAGKREAGSAQARLRRFVKRKLRAAHKARTQLEGALARESEADDLHRKGELLRGSFHLLAPGLQRVRVPDYTVDPPDEVEIELDPNLPPGEQVAACFKRERKLRRGAEEARKRLGAGAADVDALEAAFACIADGQEPGDLQGVVDLLPSRLQQAALRELDEPQEAARPKGPSRALPWHVYVSADGWRILVGRDAHGNDELTLKHATPLDLFLHVRSATGSHVIVPTPRGQTVPRDTLLDAAELACHFSERRAADRNEVDYTPRRYVRKPRGAPAGLVRLERSKTLTLRRDEARRRRLLASRHGPGDSGDS